MTSRRGIPGFLLLEDGALFRGRLFGRSAPTVAEVVFTTNMSGYQEVFTDPSYREQIVVMTHTDGYFQAATDNAAGMASALEIARFYAAMPREQRPRTMKFIQFPDHHHGEVARGKHIDPAYPWAKVAVKLTMEHPSQTLLYMYNNDLTPTNTIGAFRWNALGSAAFEPTNYAAHKAIGDD